MINIVAPWASRIGSSAKYPLPKIMCSHVVSRHIVITVDTRMDAMAICINFRGLFRKNMPYISPLIAAEIVNPMKYGAVGNNDIPMRSPAIPANTPQNGPNSIPTTAIGKNPNPILENGN